jgi:iron complex outermembrane recepter protein
MNNTGGWRQWVGRVVLATVMVISGAVPGVLEAVEPARPVAAERIAGPKGDSADPDELNGSIIGRVVDANTGVPLANVYVRLRELGRNELSHPDGSFHFLGIASRTYTVLAQRLGYAPGEVRVQVQDGAITEVEIRLAPSALEVAGIVVTATGRERGAGDTFRPTTVLGDSELRRRLEPSLAATIAHLPGLSQQYNGPVATQPVIRGMGGDRVLVLEDGQRTGDLATTGADHAITIDPITAQRIEVVRGPAGLMYGSNALGGVINVVREEVPRTLPEAATGAVSLQAETVNAGISGGASVLIPHGRVALRGEISGRTAGDTQTPLGVLPSTQVQAFSGSAGASYISTWGFFGAAFRGMDLDYGVPGEFGGQLIPGAHPGGVEIRSTRRAGRLEAGHILGFGPVSSLSADANLIHYRHDEVEGYLGERPIIGASFDNLFGSANLIVRHEHELDPVFTEGAFGLFVSGRNLRTGGGFTGTRPASTASIAGYVYEELALQPFRFQVGGRYDWTQVTPRDRTPIFTGARHIPIRERSFGSASASAGALMEPMPGWVFGASVARGFRTPSVEELYSDGPHLADFSYDIGNPELEPEIGLGGDLFLRITRPRLHAEASLFHNAIRNYIYHAPTAQLDPRFFRFPVFEATASDATFRGAEASVQWEAVRRLVLEGTVAAVRATRGETGDPLPAIPPLNGTLGARYETESFFLSAGWEAAGAQNRVPRPVPSTIGGAEPILLERPTAGYNLLNGGGGVRRMIGGRLHTVSVQIDNLGDSVWRDHLSRIKEVAPQPGRNVQLLYRVRF